MRVFAKVAESGGFTNAAVRLGMSASMVSQHVKELEERLSVRLLNRTTRKVNLIDDGFDVAIRAEPLHDSSLIARQLAPLRVVLCGAPSYFETHARPRTPADLADHNCLTMTGSALYRMWHLSAADGTALDIAPVGNLRSNISSVLETAALAGHGLAWLPTYLCSEALRSGRLVTVLDDYTAPPYTMRALYPHNRHLSAKVRAFVDFLATRFGRDPYWDKDCRALAP